MLEFTTWILLLMLWSVGMSEILEVLTLVYIIRNILARFDQKQVDHYQCAICTAEEQGRYPYRLNSHVISVVH